MRLAASWVGVAGALAAGVIATSASAASVAPCRAAQLTATMTYIRGSAGAGNVGYTLKLKNTGRSSCRLGNHPRLQLLGASGNKLPTHVRALGRTGTVTIMAGRTAGARLRFSPDVPGPGDRTRGACQPVSHKVRVTLTAPGSGSTVGSIKPPTSVCERGGIQEEPLS